MPESITSRMSWAKVARGSWMLTFSARVFYLQSTEIDANLLNWKGESSGFHLRDHWWTTSDSPPAPPQWSRRVALRPTLSRAKEVGLALASSMSPNTHPSRKRSCPVVGR